MTDEETKAIVNAIVLKLTNEGRVIEGGWRAFEVLSLKDASDTQKKEMRKAFFFGAQHLFATLMTVLEEGTEATQKDLNRISNIDRELRVFLKGFDESRN